MSDIPPGFDIEIDANGTKCYDAIAGEYFIPLLRIRVHLGDDGDFETSVTRYLGATETESLGRYLLAMANQLRVKRRNSTSSIG